MLGTERCVGRIQHNPSALSLNVRTDSCDAESQAPGQSEQKSNVGTGHPNGIGVWRFITQEKGGRR